MRAILLLISLPAIVGLSDPINFATERRAAIIATNAAIAVSAPVSNLASNAQSLALEALARPVGTDTNAVASIAGGVLETHNLSASAHTDIRADVSNAVESISLSVKTNSVGGVEVGTDCVASGKHSMAFGYGAIASGVGSRSMGYFTSAIGNYSIAEGSGTTTSGNNSRAFGQGSIAAGAGAFAAGLYSEASGTYSISLGYAGISSGYCSFVWSGYGDGMMGYSSHGDDTFNINPVGGPSGFYIGETNLQTYLDGKLSIEHDSEASAHNGRITALENRPTGLTTNTVFPFMMLSDDYNTNGVVRVAVSNGVFSIWGMK